MYHIYNKSNKRLSQRTFVSRIDAEVALCWDNEKHYPNGNSPLSVCQEVDDLEPLDSNGRSKPQVRITTPSGRVARIFLWVCPKTGNSYWGFYQRFYNSVDNTYSDYVYCAFTGRCLGEV